MSKMNFFSKKGRSVYTGVFINFTKTGLGHSFGGNISRSVIMASKKVLTFQFALSGRHRGRWNRRRLCSNDKCIKRSLSNQRRDKQNEKG